MKKIWLLYIVFFCFPLFALAELPLGEIPPQITLKGDDGGRINGEPWSSSELQGKVFSIFYVDPDEKELNDPAADAIKKMKLPKDKYDSVAIINMDATWLPNFAIQTKLKSSQKEHPNTTYVKDLKKILVKNWNLKDDSSDVIIIAPDGKVVFSQDGKLNEDDITRLKEAIRDNLAQD